MVRTKEAVPQKNQANQGKGRMSRQPPLPQGPPPRSSARDGNYSGGDSYRPRDPSPPPTFRGAPSTEGMYQFRGNNNNSNNYRSNYDDRMRSPPRRAPPPMRSPFRGVSPHRYNDYRDPPPYDSRRDDVYRPAYDSYRDRPQGADDRNEGFTFRQAPPPNLDFNQARPRSPQRQRDYAQQNVESHRSNSRSNPRRGTRGGYRGRGGPRMASEREFLRTNRAKTPELMPGMDDDQTNAVRYRAVDEMSDSDEAEMDLANSDDDADAEQGRKKQARIGEKTADGESAPRWSNPDPYTVLPPPDADRKKKDMVKLIRKARVASSSENTAKVEAAADDFISFDLGDSDEEHNLRDQPTTVVEGAPTGPRSSTYGFGSVPEASSYQPAHALHPRPTQAYPAQIPPLPAVPIKKTAPVVDLTSDPNLGNRKRTNRDELKSPPNIHGPTPSKGSKPNGAIVQGWRPISGANPTPWIALDHSGSANLGVWLHKEIMDFYHYVKPRDYEHVVRTKLVEDLRAKVKRGFQETADVLSFGSFPAGLYLPTADMDLVCVSSTYMDGGIPQLSAKKTLFRFREFLIRERLALNDRIEVIASARVPLVKYVCSTTGLKVDISFENNTGLIANQTFQDWKTEFPAMPILVTLVKHLLAMRALNEPVNGGIGGFSVICLVVSMLQHMPQVQSRSMIPEHHLGEVFLEFLDLYGNQFNTATTAIQLNPPAYLPKSRTNLPYKQPHLEKFSIIDPNKADNDISGGSSNTLMIRKVLSNAYAALTKRMGDMQYAHNGGLQSLLGCVIGGNYKTFELQREHLAHVHEHMFGPISHT